MIEVNKYYLILNININYIKYYLILIIFNININIWFLKVALFFHFIVKLTENYLKMIRQNVDLLTFRLDRKI